MNSKNKFSSDIIYLRDDKFKIETCGYWKKLSSEEIGDCEKVKLQNITIKELEVAKSTRFTFGAAPMFVFIKNYIFNVVKKEW